MNSGRRAALCIVALCGLCGPAGKAWAMPDSLSFSEAELQAQLARRFPVKRRLLDTFELHLSDPRLRVDAPTRRLSTELTLQASDQRSGRRLQGRLALGYALRYEPVDGSIRLVQPRVEHFDFGPGQGASQRRGDATQELVIAWVERLLDGMVLYRVPAERLDMLRAIGYRPGKLSVTPAGLQITIEPDLPAPASAPTN